MTTRSIVIPQDISTNNAPAKPTNAKRHALGDISNLATRFAAQSISKDSKPTKQPLSQLNQQQHDNENDETVNLQRSNEVVDAPLKEQPQHESWVEDLNDSELEDEKDVSDNDEDLFALLQRRTLPRCPATTATAMTPRTLKCLPEADQGDLLEPQLVAEYAHDITATWLKREKKLRPNENYLSSQPKLNARMRGILVDWLVEVHLSFKMSPETLFLTTNIVDRFLSLKMVERNMLQLVGITSMLIASKYEEIYPPEVSEFVFISDSAYSQKQILRVEEIVLGSLRFRLAAPTPFGFARRWVKVAGYSDNKEVWYLVNYLMELAAVDYEMLEFLPSRVAASAMLLALEVLGFNVDEGRDSLSGHLYHRKSLRSGKEVSENVNDDEDVAAELDKCVGELASLLRRASLEDAKLTAVFRKYSDTQFREIAVNDAVLDF